MTKKNEPKPQAAKPAHTPGPWISEYPYIFDVAKTRRICAFTNATGTRTKDDETIAQQDKNNARLIAAAPDLLAALIRLEGSTAHRNGDCYSDDYRGLCVCGKEAARAAILRATEGK